MNLLQSRVLKKRWAAAGSPCCPGFPASLLPAPAAEGGCPAPGCACGGPPLQQPLVKAVSGHIEKFRWR